MVPSFQEAPRCTVCNTPFSTFKRRVSTQKSTPCTISRSERGTHTHTDPKYHFGVFELLIEKEKVVETLLSFSSYGRRSKTVWCASLFDLLLY